MQLFFCTEADLILNEATYKIIKDRIAQLDAENGQ